MRLMLLRCMGSESCRVSSSKTVEALLLVTRTDLENIVLQDSSWSSRAGAPWCSHFLIVQGRCMFVCQVRLADDKSNKARDAD